MSNYIVRPVKEDDINAIVDIYNYYIINSIATFETEMVTYKEMFTRMLKVQENNLPWLIIENNEGKIIGYSYACKWRERFAYRYSVEVTVYLSHLHSGKGLGTKLYTHLFAALNDLGIHSAISGITLPNADSINLHEKFGMKQVAHFKEVGFKFNQWLDVGYWQGFIASQ